MAWVPAAMDFNTNTRSIFRINHVKCAVSCGRLCLWQ